MNALTMKRLPILVAGVLTAAIALLTPQSGHAQALPVIRVVMIPIEPAALAYYAKENGFFAKAGIDVEIDQNPSSPAAMSAVLSGTYDVAYGTVPTLATAHSKGLPLTFIAPGIADSPAHFGGAIMTGTSSTVKTGKDFNGKTLGTAGLNTIAEYLPRAWIDKNGGDSSTVKFIEMPFPVTADAIAAGRIDAAYMVEPFFTIATKKGLAKMLVTGDDAISSGEYLATGWFTTSAWVTAHPDLAVRFARAMNDAAKWANANPDKVVPILVKDFKSDPTLLAQSRRPYFAEHLVAAEVQPWIDITARYAKFPTFKADEIIYATAK
jgi:NitT/TauT family transport system substrate-binding protein